MCTFTDHTLSSLNGEPPQFFFQMHLNSYFVKTRHAFIFCSLFCQDIYLKKKKKSFTSVFFLIFDSLLTTASLSLVFLYSFQSSLPTSSQGQFFTIFFKNLKRTVCILTIHVIFKSKPGTHTDRKPTIRGIFFNTRPPFFQF